MQELEELVGDFVRQRSVESLTGVTDCMLDGDAVPFQNKFLEKTEASLDLTCLEKKAWSRSLEGLG